MPPKTPITPRQALAAPLPSRKKGRPTIYLPEYAAMAERLTLLDANLTDEKLREFFGVSLATFNAWKKAHPEFQESIARAKKPADGAVANALYRRALGYDYEEDHLIKLKGPNGEFVQRFRVTKHLAGDVTAQSLWLRNRQSGLWKAQPEPAPLDDEMSKPITGISVTVKDFTSKSTDDGGDGDKNGAEKS